MMVSARLLALLALALMSGTAHCQALWNGTFLGMSVAEAQRAAPEAREVGDADRRTVDGAELLLRTAPFELAGLHVTAGLWFASGKLVRVGLLTVGKPEESTVLSAFQTVLESLRSKYGREVSNAVSTAPRIGTVGTVKWSSGATTITLVTVTLYKQDGQLTVVYDASLAATANKL